MGLKKQTKAIAAAAGVSEAIIFRHFASKEELYKSILDRKADEIGIKAGGLSCIILPNVRMMKHWCFL